MNFRFIAALGLIAVLPLGAAVAQTPEPPHVIINVDSFSFGPRPITLAAGQPVTLVFTNHSSSGHDFTAKEFFAHATIQSGAIAHGSVALPAGSTRAVTLTPAAGSYAAHCGHFMHSTFGMKDEILVK